MKDLEFLSEKSKELLDRQIESYRLNHTKAGTMIGISALFVPIFLFIIENASPIIQVLSIIPLIFFGISLFILIRVLRTRPLYQGFRPEKLDTIINKDYEDILLYEIGAKRRDSFLDNEIITERQNKRFDKGLKTTIIAIILSILLLFGNIFINNQNKFTMGDKDKKVTTTPSDKKKKRVIPSVPKKDRTQLNEGVIPKPKGGKK